jgi:hypothetical protein
MQQSQHLDLFELHAVESSVQLVHECSLGLVQFVNAEHRASPRAQVAEDQECLGLVTDHLAVRVFLRDKSRDCLHVTPHVRLLLRF